MSTIDPKTPRNAPCPCGSGKKFKRCHGSADPAEVPDARDNRAVLFATAGAVVGSIIIGVVFSPRAGLAVAGAAAIGIGAWAIYRDPPPPKGGSDHPAAINFGN